MSEWKFVLAVSVAIATASGCGGDRVLATTEAESDSGSVEDAHPDDGFPEHGRIDSWDHARDDARDAFPEAPSDAPPDPWVPETWDVPFEYTDVSPEVEADAATCGNGVVDLGEECDDGNTIDGDECTSRCLLPRCGDGVVWPAFEECDPPGSTRACTSSCETSGTQRCDVFCRWSVTCDPPREVCGNGIDDDCDGVTDLIVREIGNVVVSGDTIAGFQTPSHVVWTGAEFAIEWQSYHSTAVLTRVDRWGRRTDWDAELVDAPQAVYGLGWTGSNFALLWQQESDSERDLYYQPFDALGFPVWAPTLVVTDAERDIGCCETLSTVTSSDGTGVVEAMYWVSPTGEGFGRYAFWRIAPDGTVLAAGAPLGDYHQLFATSCVAWTGFEYAVVLQVRVVDGGPVEQWIDFVSPSAVVARSAVFIAGERMMYSCAGAGSRLAILWNDGETANLAVVGTDGGMIGGSPVIDSDLFRPGDNPDRPGGSGGSAAPVWTGSELGLVWSDSRTGNHEVYFARFSADGVRLADDARLTRTGAESANPSLAWTGSSWGVVWNDSDGIDENAYFTHFSTCP